MDASSSVNGFPAWGLRSVDIGTLCQKAVTDATFDLSAEQCRRRCYFAAVVVVLDIPDIPDISIVVVVDAPTAVVVVVMTVEGTVPVIGV